MSAGRNDHARPMLASWLRAGLSTLTVLLAWALVGPNYCFGQGATGAINGTVTDPTGAAVPGAKVVLRNVATTSDRSVVTNEVGRYLFPAVLPGNYTISVSKDGFSTAVEPEFTLLVNQASTHDISLKVGSISQDVTVVAEGAQVQASSSELGTAIGRREVEALPLNGRNFTQLLALTPGVSPIMTNQATALSSSGGSFIGHAIGQFSFPSVNGQCNRCNMWLYDGLNNYGYVGNYAVQPILDSIQEFKVQSHNDSAAYGESMGSVVNVVSKSGTAQYHGSVFEYLRNDALDARNTFISNKTDDNGNEIPGSAVTPFKQNQFGFTFGGPLIPKREPRTFFFAAFEGFRSVRAGQQFATLPTAANLTGDLSDVAAQIYDPFSTYEDPNNAGQYLRDPFLCDSGGSPLGSGTPGPGATPCNKIPSSMIPTNLVEYSKLYWPAPYDTGITGVNFIDPTPGRVRQDTATLRIDHQFSSNTQFWIRDTYFSQPLNSGTGLPKVRSGTFYHGYHLAAAVTHTFGDGTKVLNVRFGRAWADNNVARSYEGLDEQGALDIANFSPLWAGNFTGGKRLGVGVGIQGYTGVIGGNFQGNQIANIWDTAADLTIVRGHHTFQMGTDYNLFRPQELIQFVNEGFQAINTSNPPIAGTGSGLASFLLGVPNSYGKRDILIQTHWGKVVGFYFQDQWKATNKLQINLGLRYDFTIRPAYDDYVGNFNTDTGIYTMAKSAPACGSAPCIPGGTLPEHVEVTSLKNGAIVHNTFDNIQPRLGIAYRVRPSTAIRAAAGWFYDNWATNNQWAGTYQGTWPSVRYIQKSNINNPTTANPTPTRTWDDPADLGAGAELLPAPTPFNQQTWYVDPHVKNSYMIAWNFGVQHQLGSNMILEANYVGSHSLRTGAGAFRNTAVTPGPGDIPERQPFPYALPTFMDKNVGRSSYEGFQLKAERRTSHGLTYIVSYTLSRNRNLGCDGFFGAGAGGCSIPNPYDLEANWGPAGFDLPHNLSVSWVYQLPFGRGQRFASQGGALDYIIGGWAINGILTARSGRSFSIDSGGGDTANTGGAEQRAKYLGGELYPATRNRDLFFNTDQFVTPDLYTFGNSGRNMLRNPHVTNWDFSLFKDFPLPITETTRLQFRAEFFNGFNLSPLETGGDYTGNPNFGRVFGTALTEREIQFALKLFF